jgi:hypothetical protein
LDGSMEAYGSDDKYSTAALFIPPFRRRQPDLWRELNAGILNYKE